MHRWCPERPPPRCPHHPGPRSLHFVCTWPQGPGCRPAGPRRQGSASCGTGWCWRLGRSQGCRGWLWEPRQWSAPSSRVNTEPPWPGQRDRSPGRPSSSSRLLLTQGLTQPGDPRRRKPARPSIWWRLRVSAAPRGPCPLPQTPTSPRTGSDRWVARARLKCPALRPSPQTGPHPALWPPKSHQAASTAVAGKCLLQSGLGAACHEGLPQSLVWALLQRGGCGAAAGGWGPARRWAGDCRGAEGLLLKSSLQRWSLTWLCDAPSCLLLFSRPLPHTPRFQQSSLEGPRAQVGVPPALATALGVCDTPAVAKLMLSQQRNP